MRTKSYNKITLRDLKEKLGGELHNLPEGKDITLTGISALNQAKTGEISFITTAKFAKQAETSRASAFLAPHGMVVKDQPSLCVDQVWKAVLWLIDFFTPEVMFEPHIDETARVSENVKIEDGVSIGAYTVINDHVTIGMGTRINSHVVIGSNTKIGKGCVIAPRVVIMDGTMIGNNVILHPGAVIGADGYKYEMIDDVRAKIPQVGNVVIEDDVEIGANTCIDRASFAETRIGKGTKIDNLVHIAHNVTIGKNCLIISQVGIAGSSTIGDNCVLAGQVGIADNITIGSNVILGAKSGVHRNIPDKGRYLGIPAVPAKQFARIIAVMQKLPELNQNWNRLHGQVNQMIDRLESGID